MWESRRDFQRGWEAGFMAFHPSILCHFHGLLFARQMLDKPNAAAHCNVPHSTRDAHTPSIKTAVMDLLTEQARSACRDDDRSTHPPH